MTQKVYNPTQTVLGNYGDTFEERRKHCIAILEQVKDVYDRYPNTVHSDIDLTVMWLREWCNIKVDPKTLAFLQEFRLTHETVTRSGRKLRSLSKKGVIPEIYERDQDYAETLENAYVSAFCGAGEEQ